MTLGEFLEQFSQHHELIVFYAIATPLTAILAGVFGKGQGHLSPWRYLYSFLVYLSALPGLFALTLNVYTIGFEGRSLMETDLFTQIIPIVVMILTIWIISRNVSLDLVPGFDRLASLFMLILLIFTILWVLEKTRVLFISVFPFPLAIIFVIFLIVAGIRLMRTLFR